MGIDFDKITHYLYGIKLTITTMESPMYPTLVFYDQNQKVTLIINLVAGFEIDRTSHPLIFPIKIKNNGVEYGYVFASDESRSAALNRITLLLSDWQPGVRVIKINP